MKLTFKKSQLKTMFIILLLSLAMIFLISAATFTLNTSDDLFVSGSGVTLNCTISPSSGFNITSTSIYTNYSSNSWKANFTDSTNLTTGVSRTFNVTITGLTDNLKFEWGCQVSEVNATNQSDTNSLFSFNRSVEIQLQPDVIINAPPTGYNSSSEVVQINVSVNSSTTSSTSFLCRVWSNQTGSWGVEPLSTTIANATATNISHNFKTTGSLLYGVRCVESDNQNVYGWSTVNKTVNIDTTNPSIILNSPASASWSRSASVIFNATPTDTSLTDCIFYFNSTGTMISNSTNATVVSGNPWVFTKTIVDGLYQWRIGCNDAAGNFGNSSIYDLFVDNSTAGISTIANVSAGAFCDRINITWNTTEPTNGSMNYGTSATSTTSVAISTSTTFQKSHSATLIFNNNKDTTYYINLTSCNQAGICNSSYVQHTTETPSSLCTGYSVYSIMQSNINMSQIASDSGADFVYWFNQTAQSFVSHTAGTSTNAGLDIDNSACVFLFEGTNSTWWRAKTDTSDFMYSLYGAGDNFISANKGYNFFNLSEAFFNSSDGTDVGGSTGTPTYYALYNNSWDGSDDGKYTSYVRDTAFNNQTNITLGDCFWVFSPLNVTFNSSGRQIQ